VAICVVVSGVAAISCVAISGMANSGVAAISCVAISGDIVCVW